jgi:hypothetical protein
MFRAFSKKPLVELVSLHIPKTAGTSFRDVLASVYGKKGVHRLDHGKFPKNLPAGLRVIHGHFQWPELRDFYGLGEAIPLITWVRDPADRVISNYYYLQKILKEHLQEEKKNLNVLAKMQRTLLEYASAELARNRMSKFLEGVPLDRFIFIGVSERFGEDVEKLASMLGWKGYRIFHHNDGAAEKRSVDEKVRAEILRLNERDVELYEKVLKLRGPR